MVSLKQKVYDYLTIQPLFRERKNKDRGIVNLLVEKYPELKSINMTVLTKMVQDYNSMDRSWRQILEKTVRLRGTDYGDKDELVEKKQRELGYNVGSKE